MVSDKDWVTIGWATTVPLLVAFSAVAMFISFRHARDNPQTVESFITARDSIGFAQIAWSFYVGALGSWAIALPANYASSAGLLGLCMFALASGLAILLVAFLGQLVRNKLPDACSVADYAHWRFGPLAQLYVALLVLFNMSMAMLAEYSTLSTLFRHFVGTNHVPILLAISATTLVYTICGGLFVSILTDQFQGAASVAFACVVAVYVAVNFDAKLPTPLTNKLKGFNEAGYSSILTLPVAMVAATAFSDASWQRCWASSSQRTLAVGALLGAIGNVVMVFGLGFLGFVALWAGMVELDTNANLYLFQIFKYNVRPGMAKLNNVAALFAILAAVTMSQAAVSSLQNGIMATASSYLLKRQPLFMTRTLTFALNVALIVVGIRRYNVLKLFLVSSLLCATSIVPLALGLVEALHTVYTGDMMFYSCALSALSVSAFGVQQKWEQRTSTMDAISQGIRHAWYLNGYNWRYFLVAVASSLAAVAACILLGLPFTLLGWRGLSPTRLVHAVQDRISDIWHLNPSKEESARLSSRASGTHYYNIPVKRTDTFPGRPSVAWGNVVHNTPSTRSTMSTPPPAALAPHTHPHPHTHDV